MADKSGMTRRRVLAGLAGLGGSIVAAGQRQARAAGDGKGEEASVKGRLKQSVSRWCYGKIELDTFCRACKAMGLAGIDLLDLGECAAVQRHGLVCTMVNGPGGIPLGWNNPKYHDGLVERSEEMLPEIAEAGHPNMIVFSGNRRGMADSEGLKNCVTGLRRILPLAEELGVTVTMELLNSKRDHKDYMADHTAWGAELVKALGSERFKLLYDIYHMQIMEGDVIQTILDYHDCIGHYHTGGVPGRNEIDETQELNYPRICEAIVETGFTGYLAHEFVPKGDPLTALREGVRICDV